MKCANDCFASGLVGVWQTSWMSLLSSTRAVCAGCRNIDATFLGYFRVVDGRGERAANAHLFFYLLPIWGFSNEKKGIQDYHGRPVIAQRNTIFRSWSTGRYARPGEETALFVMEA